MADVTYYFNSDDDGSDWTDPANMNDGSILTYGYTSSNNFSHIHDDSTAPGTDLGTITKVECRQYLSGDGNDYTRNSMLFVAGGSSDFHDVVAPVSPGWSSYFEITTDNNAPSPWTWGDVDALEMNITKQNSGKGNETRVYKTEIRVTYTPGNGDVYSGRGVGRGIGRGIMR